MNIYETEECVICLDDNAKPSKALAPCGHKCCCNECIEKIRVANQPCPLCRQVILDVREFVLEDVDVVNQANVEQVEEFKEQHRATYMENMRSVFAKTAGYLGKGKLSRSVAMATCDELETRRRETAGTERIMVGSKVDFEVLGENRQTLSVSYRPKGKRKDVKESYPLLPWGVACNYMTEGLDGDTLTAFEFAAHYPEYYWLFHHHNQGKVEDSMRDLGILTENKRRRR